MSIKKLSYFKLLVFCSAVMSAQSPITLGNANMPSSGDTLRYTNVKLTSIGNYTQTGVNFNWDFSTMISTTEGLRSFKSALSTPYAIFFLSLNEYGEKIADTIGGGPVTFTRYYNFYKKQTSPNAFIADGAGITFSNIPLPSYYSDKDELYNFPMTYPKYDSTTFKFSTITSTIVPIRYSKTGYRVTTVDGWGTIKTPFGIENCLRLITTQYSKDSVKTSLGPISIPFGFVNVQRSYQWFTTTSKIPYFEITGTLVGSNFTPTLARYRGYKIAVIPTGLNEFDINENFKIFPNPVHDKLSIMSTAAGALQIKIYDEKGMLVKSTNFASGEAISIDVSALASGVYLVSSFNELSAGTNTIKFLKQ